jgi:hypothetical protein
MKGGVERPFFKVQNALGDFLNPESDRVPVHPALGGQGLQDQQVERAFETIIRMCAHFYSHSQLYKKAEHCVKRVVNQGPIAGW